MQTSEIAMQILCTHLAKTNANLDGKPAERARTISEMYRIIHQGVFEARASVQPPPARA